MDDFEARAGAAKRKRRSAAKVICGAGLLLIALAFAGGFFLQKVLLQPNIDELNSKNASLAANLADLEKGAAYAKGTSIYPAESGEAGVNPHTVLEPFLYNGVIIVNKRHPLPENYDPGENSEAVGKLKELIAAGQASGDRFASELIEDWSGYRSYWEQAGVYEEYVSQDGQQLADSYAARPGYSEHQTGLVFDLRVTGGRLYRNPDPEYNFDTDWVVNNAPKYGFIIRYRDSWQKITGYAGEPWHIRYVGAELAEKVRASGKSLEEYLGIPAGDYL